MTWKMADEIFYAFAFVVNFRPDPGHIPCLLKMLGLCRGQMHEQDHFFQNISGRRVALATDQLIHGRTIQPTVFGHGKDLDVFGVDIFGKNIRKCGHVKNSFRDNLIQISQRGDFIHPIPHKSGY